MIEVKKSHSKNTVQKSEISRARTFRLLTPGFLLLMKKKATTFAAASATIGCECGSSCENSIYER